MCERNSCQIVNTTTTTISATECKCQTKFYSNQLQQRLLQQSHHSPKQYKTNVNMQRQQQQMNHMQMPFQPPHDNNGSHRVHLQNRSPTSSTSSLDSNYSSDSSCSSMRNSPSPPAATAAGASSSSSSSTPSIGVNLRVTGQCSQGGRKYMEDYFSVAYQQSENAKDLEYAFIGIYDGHGGAEAATFAKEHLMLEIVNQKLFWSDSDQDVLRAIREGYIATHYAMWRDQENWPKTANGLPSTAGTTATVAFIRREKIYIGHVGDSGIVLGYQNDNENFWRAKQLTTDHKPESMAERTRIINSGGKVIVKSGVPRVVWNRPRSAAHKGPIRQNTPVDEIPFLAVARSLGDLWSYNSELNEFIVSPDPDVKVIKINPNTFRCLIFGTDGLWNVVTAQNAVDTVYEKETINERLQAQRGESPNEGAQWTNPSKSLVDQALKTWSTKKMRADNTSVVTVILYPPGNNGIIENTPAADSQPPSTFRQSNSYGLEYTQVNAEIPTNDDATTYREMAQKYLPPEQYRNFNFYDEDEVAAIRPLTAEEQSQIDPITVKNMHSGNVYWHNMNNGGGHDEITKSSFANDNDIWRWNEKSERSEVSAMVELHNSNIDADEVEAKDAACTDLNYTDYVASDIPASLNGIIATAASDCMNGFAATYNTLLSEQMTHEASTSNSNPSSYHSLSGSSMHEILQEQHRYQQECMSEEEGYSLTKLETRREQQRCTAASTSASGVQTFKIFQQNQESNTTTANYEQDPSKAIGGDDEAPTNYWKLSYPPTSGAIINKFMAFQQHQEQKQQQQQKPLELNSLLEQEREEEQQVALERQELLHKLATETTATKSTPASTDVDHEQPTSEGEEHLVEEYLDEELVATAHDETVQINEISSSMTDSMQADMSTESPSSTEPMNCEMLVDDENPDCSISIEKIEILHVEDPPLIREGASEKTPTLQCAHSTKSIKSDRTKQASGKRTQTFYPNIPNENQRSSAAFSTYTLNRYRRLDQSSASSSGPSTSNSNSSSCNSEKRQLRSSSGIVDYSKRTLRTRNSLTKDMKAKSTLTSTLKRTATTASHFLRTTAASLLGSSNNNSNTSATTFADQNATCGSNKKLPKVEKHSLLAPPPPVTNAINLRSRQIGHATVKLPTTATPPNNNNNCLTAITSTPTLNATPLLHRRERRNLRSLSTRSVGSRESTMAPSSPAGFSKSTRLQSSASTLAAPPPSPKLINAAAAVAAATRARSLLSKNTAAIQAVFGKRSSLRSGGSTTIGSSSTISAVDQTTRSRVSKRRHRR